MRYGLRLYTLRHACARDLAGTLAFVAACGYAGVEVAAMPAAEHADWMLVELDRCASDLRELARASAAWLALAQG